MNEFDAMRKRARGQRDQVIAEAKAEFEKTLVEIAALEQKLLKSKPRPPRPAGACIGALIPRDRPFTVPEIMAALEATYGHRVWCKKTVRNHVNMLRERGILRRISRSKGAELPLFVCQGVKVTMPPLADLTLPEVAQQVLVRPMGVTELAVAILEAGFQTTQSQACFRHSVGKVLREGPFRRIAPGKWELEMVEVRAVSSGPWPALEQ